MFKTMVFKEVLDYTRSLRFMLGFLIMFVLMLAAVFLLSAESSLQWFRGCHLS